MSRLGSVSSFHVSSCLCLMTVLTVSLSGVKFLFCAETLAFLGDKSRPLDPFTRCLLTYCQMLVLVMFALCNRADHYSFALRFLSSSSFFFSSPNLSGRRLDVYHTSTHGVALVRI